MAAIAQNPMLDTIFTGIEKNLRRASVEVGRPLRQATVDAIVGLALFNNKNVTELGGIDVVKEALGGRITALQAKIDKELVMNSVSSTSVQPFSRRRDSNLEVQHGDQTTLENYQPHPSSSSNNESSEELARKILKNRILSYIEKELETLKKTAQHGLSENQINSTVDHAIRKAGVHPDSNLGNQLKGDLSQQIIQLWNQIDGEIENASPSAAAKSSSSRPSTSAEESSNSQISSPSTTTSEVSKPTRMSDKQIKKEIFKIVVLFLLLVAAVIFGFFFPQSLFSAVTVLSLPSWTTYAITLFPTLALSVPLIYKTHKTFKECCCSGSDDAI